MTVIRIWLATSGSVSIDEVLCSGRAQTARFCLFAGGPTPTTTPSTTPIAGCACNTTSSTVPQPASTITFTSTDSCPPEDTRTASNSTTGAIYFTAQVQFNSPIQAGSLTAADFGVGSVAAASLSNNNSANCSCGTTVRREATPGTVKLSVKSQSQAVVPVYFGTVTFQVRIMMSCGYA